MGTLGSSACPLGSFSLTGGPSYAPTSTPTARPGAPGKPSRRTSKKKEGVLGVALHCHPVSLHARACASKCQFPSVGEIWSLVLY
jgi:hypothetical protein